MDVWALNIPLLWVAVVLNLLLTIGLVRKLNAMQSNAPALPRGLPDGSPLPDATVVDLEGTLRPLAGMLNGPTALLFLSPACEGCRDQLPALGALARQSPPVRILAVLAATEVSQAPEYVEGLVGASFVLAPGSRTDALERLRVSVFPTFVVVDGQGRVRATTHTSEGLARAMVDVSQRHGGHDVRES